MSSNLEMLKMMKSINASMGMSEEESQNSIGRFVNFLNALAENQEKEKKERTK